MRETPTIAIGRRLTRWRRRTIPARGTAQGIALVLFAVFPGPECFTDRTLSLYLLGAFLLIIARNALAIVTGHSGRSLG